MKNMETVTSCHQAPLLRSMPPEIRNRIYYYVITDEGNASVVQVSGVNDATARFRLYPHDPEKRRNNFGLNQLRSVCRQLHWETRGFGLRNNTLHFDTVTHPKGCAASCVAFLDHCSHTHLAAISRIKILDVCGTPLIPYRKRSPWDTSTGRWDFPLFDVEAIFELAKYCAAYPNISIDVFLPRLASSGNLFDINLAASALLLAVRKRRMEFPSAPDDVDVPVQAMARVWEGYAEDVEPLPVNLRFFTDYKLSLEEIECIKEDLPRWKDFVTQVETWQKHGM
ncbi:hypothetical protein BU23DRAFT_101004 [Bimuria novae-zelandiae CBS 107.79]|uniref:Uncharacterized protein n=1 Tax=Bimuria novae-zelandiae CBS 107.79 TaxID=1447943 RepID=A0A6A5VXG5_9PLEO|nr:hypothetical protein BU23DRAFT_101004 [Bimuria novae-zelandiae CBS 107.79]